LVESERVRLTEVMGDVIEDVLSDLGVELGLRCDGCGGSFCGTQNLCLDELGAFVFNTTASSGDLLDEPSWSSVELDFDMGDGG
jgi:hypothetical protein